MRMEALVLLASVAVATASSFEETKRAAEAGDLQAQLELGQMYYLGEGVQTDEKEGRRWIEKAANSHQCPDASYVMGVIHVVGDSVEPKSPSLAMFYLGGASMNKDKLREAYRKNLPRVLADAKAEMAAYDMKVQAFRKMGVMEEKQRRERIERVDREIEEEKMSPAREFVSALSNLKGARKPEENTSYLQSSKDAATHIVLGDGTTWDVDPLDKIKADLWLPNSGVTTVRADGGGIYDHVLINKETGEQIRAREEFGAVDR